MDTWSNVSMASMREKHELEEQCQSLQQRIEQLEMRNALDGNTIEHLKGKVCNQETAMRGLTTELEGLRKGNHDANQAKIRFMEAVMVLEEVHRADTQKLTAEHERVVQEMKSQHEIEIQSMDAELIGAKDALLRHGARGRDVTTDESTSADLEEVIKGLHSDERKQHKEETKGIMSLLGELDGKFSMFDGKMNNLEGLVESNVLKAVEKTYLILSKLDKKYYGLENLVTSARKEGIQHHQDVRKSFGDVGVQVGEVARLTDALLEDSGQQHAVVNQGICHLDAEIKKIDRLMNVMLDREYEHNKDVKQTISNLNGEIDNKVASLQQDGHQQYQDILNAIDDLNNKTKKMVTDLLGTLRQDGRTKYAEVRRTMEEMETKVECLENALDLRHLNGGQQIENLGEKLDGKMDRLLATLQGGHDQQTAMKRAIDDLDSEIDKKVKKLESWIENLNFKIEKTSIMKICNI
jgi:uncharacterized coiled-coil protein SlyX